MKILLATVKPQKIVSVHVEIYSDNDVRSAKKARMTNDMQNRKTKDYVFL